MVCACNLQCHKIGSKILIGLAAEQVLPYRDHSLDQDYAVPALRDVLQFARPLVEERKVLGLYIETKQPSWHDGIGLPLEQPLLQLLDEEGWFTLAPGAVVLQSFEPEVDPRLL